MNAEIKKRINDFELNYYRRLLNIHYTTHTTNIWVRELVTQHLGRHDSLLSVAKKWKLRWFGHVVRAKCTLANTILQGTVEGTRKRGAPKGFGWMTLRTGQDVMWRSYFALPRTGRSEAV